ncbi:MAG: helix-turn-helix transcriptional regulator [Planctomycetota bacterium]
MIFDEMQDLKRQRGEVLRQARREAGLSARKLADRINTRTPGSGLTDNAIYAYESGRVLLSREVAERVSAVLNVRLGELLVGDPDFTDAAVQSSGAESGVQASGGNRVGDPACERLHLPVTDLLRTARTLVRMLALPRFELASPAGFLHGFELLASDGRRVLQHDDVASAPRRSPGAAQDAIEQTARAVADLIQHAETEYATLRAAGRSGSCVEACHKLAGTLAERVARLTEAHQHLIERGGLKPGLADAEPATEGDLADVAPWARLEPRLVR